MDTLSLDHRDLTAVAFLPRAAMITAGFGAIWLYEAVGNLGGAGREALLALLPGLVLLCLALRSMRASRRALRRAGVAPSEVRWSPGRRRGYWLIVAGEALVIVALAILLPRIDFGWAVAPSVCLVLGIHFFPLGALLENASLYRVGGILTLWSLVVVAALPPAVRIQSFAAGMGAGFVLLLSSARSLVRAASLRRKLADSAGA